jgi:glycosyltransferase involved in cell wall biosynthesis
MITDFEILPVAQVSDDQTFAVLHKYDNSTVIKPSYLSKRGKGLACSYGINKSVYEWILTYDDDCEYPLNFILDAVPLTKKYDIIIGSRMYKKNIPFIRVVASFSYRFIAHSLFNLKGIYDIQSGEKLFKKNIFSTELYEFDKINLNRLPYGYVWDTAVLACAKRIGKKIAEVPILYVYSGNFLRLSKAWIDMFFELIKLRFSL